MGITLTSAQQTYFDTYANHSKTADSSTLDLAYADFLKVLKDNDSSTSKVLIYLNRYLDPTWFSGSNYQAATLTTFYTLLDSYVSTTDQATRNTKHREVVNYLNNTTVAGLFIKTLTRTSLNVKVSEYTDGGDIAPSYVAAASASSSLGSTDYTPTLI